MPKPSITYCSLYGLLLFLICLPATLAADTLQPFTTDGCSVFPDGLPNHRDLWLRCCNAHDRAYWLGGTYDERRAADKQLRSCVADAGEPAIAEIMLRGVRVGGSPWWPTSFRWGYGWPWGRGYQAITPKERALAERLLKEYDTAPGP